MYTSILLCLCPEPIFLYLYSAVPPIKISSNIAAAAAALVEPIMIESDVDPFLLDPKLNTYMHKCLVCKLIFHKILTTSMLDPLFYR